MQPLFHIVSEAEWDAACELGSYAPESLAGEGFVHFSFAGQVAGTATARFAGHEGLIVVEVDPHRLDEPVVLEDLYGLGEEFPHVYAAIPTSAAVARHRLTTAADGTVTFEPAGRPD
jgi:uncharacterized protein (DUF952 family)